MDYRAAKHAELFSVAEKDERYFKTCIEDDVQEIAQRCLGVRRWVQFRCAITILSRFGYFSINALDETPTLGEEFCETRSRTSSLTQRLMTIILNNDLQLPKEIPKPLVSLIKDVHMITFFFFGDFYEFSKRFTGVSHIGQNLNNHTNSKYDILNRIIGCVSLIKLILNLPKQAEILGQEQNVDPQEYEQLITESPQTSGDIHSEVICQLCSSKRKEPTSTLCGHIFCWFCIHKWLKDRNECPICRMPTEPSRLIHLVNFR